MPVFFASGTLSHPVPSAFWTWPFIALLLGIAILPLLHRTHHWWESNRNKLIVSAALACASLTYYYFREYGVAVHSPAAGVSVDHAIDENHAHDSSYASADDLDANHRESPHAAGHHTSAPGWPTVLAVLDHAVLGEFVPFFVLLFSLYVIAGGIVVRGDIQAKPATNTAILAVGGLLASLIGTTGASMVLIRLLLRTNSERQRVVHTVIFFIFIVSNIGGSLLPIGDPPLFLGYLRGVPFFWTLGLVLPWAFTLGILLTIYYFLDRWAYGREAPADIVEDKEHIEPLRLAGMLNILWLIGVVFAVATLDPSKPFPGTAWHAPPYLREGVQLAFVALSLVTTKRGLRAENRFNYVAIMEIACLFIGIFITMQTPLEILNAHGASLGVTRPWQFFWATGVLSSFLDNAPTYMVFFETANSLTHAAGPGVLTLLDGNHIRADQLVAISCGAVFMGANSYIGNGPNFMVKTIAEQAGVRMPSFFGYMAYSTAILAPIFIALTFLFFRG